MAMDAQRSSAPIAAALMWFEERYEFARSLGRHAEARLIALRICEVIEQAEFTEAAALSSPLIVASDDD
jgi:hypothetical protein